MLTYLSDGWFCPTQPHQLRTEVLDGVLDSAGLLLRAGVPREALDALKQALERHAPPFDPGPEGADRRSAVVAYILERTDDAPVLQGFMMDCLEAAVDEPSWHALCAHLGHIADTLALLQAARAPQKDSLEMAAAGLAPSDAPRATPRPSAQS
jgi:hypothetical protein